MVALEEVIAGCRKGDPSMQNELYKMYSSRFYALCLRYSTDEAAAEDALIEGFMAVYQNIGSYSGAGSFEGWMQTIFIRRAIRVWRNSQGFDLETLSEETFAQATGADTDKEIDLRDALLDCMARMSDKQRALLNLIAVEGYSFVEVAEMMQIPVSTLKSQYYDIRDTMKRLLRKRLGKKYIDTLL